MGVRILILMILKESGLAGISMVGLNAEVSLEIIVWAPACLQCRGYSVPTLTRIWEQ